MNRAIRYTPLITTDSSEVTTWTRDSTYTADIIADALTLNVQPLPTDENIIYYVSGAIAPAVTEATTVLRGHGPGDVHGAARAFDVRQNHVQRRVRSTVTLSNCVAKNFVRQFTSEANQLSGPASKKRKIAKLSSCVH